MVDRGQLGPFATVLVSGTAVGIVECSSVGAGSSAVFVVVVVDRIDWRDRKCCLGQPIED